MSYPILKDLPEHLKIISDTKNNPAFLLLAALLKSEDVLNESWYDEIRERIAWFILCLNDSNNHDGDCVQQSISCLLCHSLDVISETEDDIIEGKKQWPDLSDDKILHNLIRVILLTQPPKSINNEYVDYETDITKRIELANLKTDDLSEKINNSIIFVEKMLKINPKILTEWWKLGCNSLIFS